MSAYSKITAITFIIVGMFCLIYPFASAVAIELIIGICMFIGAAMSLFALLAQRGFWDKLTMAVLTLIYGAGGYLLLTNVLGGVIALGVVLGAIFIAQGVYALIYWFNVKSRSRVAILHLFSALASILLGSLMLSSIVSGIWIVGTLVGLNLLFEGIAILLGGSSFLTETD